jgi:hypothetical protein
LTRALLLLRLVPSADDDQVVQARDLRDDLCDLPSARCALIAPVDLLLALAQ